MNTPLTLLERAKVAAAIGGVVTIPGDEFLDLCEMVEGVREIKGNVARAREEVRTVLEDAQAERRAAVAERAEADALLARAARGARRAMRLLAASIVLAGIGFGTFVAGLIL